MTRLKPIAEQVIVITGASSGIGRATALMAARRGASVVLAARGRAALDAVVAEIERDGGRAHAVEADVSDRAATIALAQQAIAAFGRIDSWVNNAGVAIAGKLADVPEADMRRLFDINFWGVINGSTAALPHLRAQGGALINLGSFTSDVAAPYMGIYSASKHAIKGYTDALRIELKMERAPVSVTLIKPAPIATPVMEHQRNQMDRHASMPPPFYQPEDVARSILYAAEHPTRSLAVGGSARLGAIVGQALPHLTDAVAAAIAARTFRMSAPREDRPDNLYAPSIHTRVHGDPRGHVPHASLYTAARLAPLRSAAIAVGSGAALFALLRRRS